MLRIESEPELSAGIARDFLTRHLPHRVAYHRLRQLLLEDRENTQPTPTREHAITTLWDIAAHAATYGTGRLGFQTDFAPFRVPPIPSLALVNLEIIKDPETIKQIKAREGERSRRGKGPPENWLVVCRTIPEQTQQLGLEHINSPILMITEHYTITIPEDPTIELDRVGVFAMYLDELGPTILFLGETQEPHGHVQIGDFWYRIDAESHPDFSLPEKVQLPPPKKVDNPCPATNDQIATLLVLFYEGIRAGEAT